MKKKLILFTTLLAMLLVTAGAVALAQTEPVGDVGFITSISGAEVLVEEDPQDPVSGGTGSGKGSYTVSGETEILWWQNDELVPATFEDLEVGQLVAATYAGPILESYPTQGGAGSIVILSEDHGSEPGDDDQLLCLLPEGCDIDGDGVPDLEAGEPAPDGEPGSGTVQYDSAA